MFKNFVKKVLLWGVVFKIREFIIGMIVIDRIKVFKSVYIMFCVKGLNILSFNFCKVRIGIKNIIIIIILFIIEMVIFL